MDPTSGTAFSDLAVEPAAAGQLTIEDVDRIDDGVFADRLVFAADALFTGTATLRYAVYGTTSVVTVNVGGAGSVAATFTPRSAPGPCIQLGGATAIDFGTVELGTPIDAAATTTLSKCSDIGQVVRASVTNATAGASTYTPIKTAAGPNQFNYGLLDEAGTPGLGPFTQLDGTSTQVRAFAADPGPFSYIIRHQLVVGAGSTTGLGAQFSTTLTFTAVAA
jgi:spore coat protein U-like protein